MVITANDQILDSYFDKVKRLRDQETKGQGEAIYYSSVGDVAFERTAVHLMNDKSRFATTASSPFRRTNFDLLYTLCTQAAIHRLLREYTRNQQQHEIAFVFLQSFYTDRAVDFFDGDLPFGRADEFLDELLQTPPALLTTGLVDPLGTAESIIRMRNQVATEWKEYMSDVPNAHLRVRQAILSKRNVPTDSTSSTTTTTNTAAAGGAASGGGTFYDNGSDMGSFQ